MTLSFHPVTGSHMPNPTMAMHGLGRLGAGQGLDTGSIASMAATGAATTGAILAGLASPTIAALAPEFALAGPIGAAVAVLTEVGLMIANVFSGCGQTCVAASNIANQVGDYLQKNLDAYMSAPVHYYSMQQAALNNFDTAWAALVKACGDPQLQAAGQRCVSDRQSGACHWHTSPGGWAQVNGQWQYTAPGPDGSGSVCWNWFVGQRDPIANDPTVVPDPTPESLSSGSGASPTGSGTGAGTGTLASSTVNLPVVGNVPVLGLVGAGLLVWAVMS